MKIKFLLPGLLALVVAGAPVLTANSVSAKQEPAGTMQKKPTMAERLKLTSEQKAKIQKIRQETQKQVEGVLNKEQKDQYAKNRGAGMKPGKALQSLKLSKDQNTKLKGILDSAKKQIQSVLTTEQQETLKKSRGQGRPEEL